MNSIKNMKSLLLSIVNLWSNKNVLITLSERKSFGNFFPLHEMYGVSKFY